MMNKKNTSEQWLQKLRTERDEVRLRVHLANAEIQDEWEELEKRWEKFQAKYREVGAAASESAEDVGAALDLLANELKAGYHRIGKHLH